LISVGYSMIFLFYLLVSDTYPDGCFVLGRKPNRFRFVGCCTYELNPRLDGEVVNLLTIRHGKQILPLEDLKPHQTDR
ncbi:MAG: hypothetical protein OSB18_15360, partial [SAR324 cluster bacterium]|nr:hypothetical protein [SAR324 cluster bacterium]